MEPTDRVARPLSNRRFEFYQRGRVLTRLEERTCQERPERAIVRPTLAAGAKDKGGMGRTVVGAKYPGQHEESRAGIRRHRPGQLGRALRLRMIAGSEGQLRQDKPSVRGLAIQACAPVGQCPGKLRLPGIQGGPCGQLQDWCIQRIIGGEFGHGRSAICRLGALEDTRLDSTQVPGARHQCCAITRRYCRPEQSLKSSGFHRVIHRAQCSTGAIHFSGRGQCQNEFSPDFD